LAIAAVIVLAVSAVPLFAGSGGRSESALTALPSGRADPASARLASAAPDAPMGIGDIDVLDLTGKGALVAALLYLTLRALRRLQADPRAGTYRLEVLETRSLGPRASLHLVAIGERRLVVGLTPGGIVGIAELDAAELDAAEFDAADFEAAERIADGGAAGLRVLVRDGWAGARRAASGRRIARAHGARPDAGRRKGA
jgi:flagellar biogenesis protein FliO